MNAGNKGARLYSDVTDANPARLASHPHVADIDIVATRLES
jgi:hypothetical protein